MFPQKKNAIEGGNLHNSQADPWMKPPSVIKLSTGLWSSLANVGSHWCRRWRHAWIEGKILPGDSENRKWAATKTTRQHRQLNSVKTQRKIRTMVGSCKSSSWLVTLPNIINQLGHVKQFNLQTTENASYEYSWFPKQKIDVMGVTCDVNQHFFQETINILDGTWSMEHVWFLKQAWIDMCFHLNHWYFFALGLFENSEPWYKYKPTDKASFTTLNRLDMIPYFQTGPIQTIQCRWLFFNGHTNTTAQWLLTGFASFPTTIWFYYVVPGVSPILPQQYHQSCQNEVSKTIVHS